MNFNKHTLKINSVVGGSRSPAESHRDVFRESGIYTVLYSLWQQHSAVYLHIFRVNIFFLVFLTLSLCILSLIPSFSIALSHLPCLFRVEPYNQQWFDYSAYLRPLFISLHKCLRSIKETQKEQTDSGDVLMLKWPLPLSIYRLKALLVSSGCYSSSPHSPSSLPLHASIRLWRFTLFR